MGSDTNMVELLRGETFVVIATRMWDALWRDSQQVMSRIARHNRVLYVEPGHNPDMPHGREFVRNLPHFIALRHRRVGPNLIVVSSPSTLPLARGLLPRAALRATVPVVVSINALALTRHVRRVMRRLHVEAPILWLYEPRHLQLVGAIGEKLVCYYNYDEYADFVHNVRIRDVLQRYDDELTRRAHVVFASSRAQVRRREAINPHTYFSPNGVDFELFSRALDPALPLPTDVAGLRRPIIGFAGWLAYHIDVELLRGVAAAYPGCSLVLVGPDELPETGAVRRLRAMPNVHFLGRKEPAELPSYLKSFDVALMPYAVVGHIRSAYPIKLHEYLAAGRAAVAVALPELEPFQHVVRLAATRETFIHQVGEALHDSGPEAVAGRAAVARENTWDRRVAAILQTIERRLATQTTGNCVEDHIHRLDNLRSAP